MKKHWILLNTLLLFHCAFGNAPGDEHRLCTSGPHTKSYADNEQVLLDSYNYFTLVSGFYPPPVWVSDNRGSANGWIEEVGEGVCKHQVRTCDYRVAGTHNNWLFTQYIHFFDSKQVFIEVTYNFGECQLASACSNSSVDLYVYNASLANPIKQINVGNYQLLATLSQPSSNQEDQTETVSIETPGESMGFYLAFKDSGTCGNIKHVRVYYKVCPAKHEGLAAYPTLPLPVRGSSEETTANAFCAPNSISHNSEYKALGDGSCVYNARCECRLGYELVNMEHGDVSFATCRVCDRGTYRSHEQSDTSCQACPANTITSGVGVSICPCLDGYYRTEDEGPDVPCTPCDRGTYRSQSDTSCQACPANTITSGVGVSICPCLDGYYKTEDEGPDMPCTPPPSACRDIIVDSSTTYNQITVNWKRPEVTGRDDFYYNIFHVDSSCIDKRQLVQHNVSPFVDGGLNLSYTVSGLSPFTGYTIRVTVHNGVSDQDKEGEDTRMCEITAETLPNQPALLNVMSGIALWNATDSDAQYKVRWLRDTDEKNTTSRTLPVYYVLNEDTKYNVQVQTVDDNGEEKWCEPLSLQFRDMDECTTNNHNCDQSCHNTMGSFYCSCRTGYTLSTDGHSCLDINECASNSHGCAHNCYNTIGSYRCSCRNGYRLSGNAHGCNGIISSREQFLGGNTYGNILNVTCNAGQGESLSRLISEHDNGWQDRWYNWYCRQAAPTGLSGCYWTDYVNPLDLPVLFQCNPNYIMVGVYSYYRSYYEDRQFKFRCCRHHDYCTKNCQISDYLNNLNQPINFGIGHGQVIVGAYSWHENVYEDRKWKLGYCDYQVC